jgi:8-oxo-dGTP pyrophosphatase MutT (NUDIX family)
MPDSLKSISAVEIRRRLSNTRMPEDPLAVDVSDLANRWPVGEIDALTANLRPAGVLIPIIERRASLSVLLTVRSSELTHHAGQISFPGGGMESHDIDIAATALREAQEEVGIHPHDVDIAGFLLPTPTVTGFAVTPVVGFVRETFSLRLDPVEVETAFEVPLDFLMDVRNEEHSEREFRGSTFPVVTFHYDGHRIWGATASILVTLRHTLIEY